MHSIDFLQEKVRIAISEHNFISQPLELYEPISYTMADGGKRLRPVITLMACDLFGGDIEDAVSLAIGFEVFHNFTLIHDDIMDQAPIRRNKETVYKKWNTNIAILSGDTMFAMGYAFVSNTKVEYLQRVLKIFNQTAIEVCEGQQYDLNYETIENVEISDYIEMIRLKTAALIAACLKAGATVAGASVEDCNKIYEFGTNIGLAFQLQDDLLDVFGDEAIFGKKTGGDIITNKKTYLYIKAFEIADEETRNQLNNSFLLAGQDEEKVNQVKEIYSRLNINEIVEREIDNYYQKALINLEEINIEEERKSEIKTFAANLMKRDY
ncbi:MAG: polyprenyl synthetase family protein [Saprospiraceae bacterium]|nr:polyprenyl synthetase family protein [Saprospiraceae bacterium]